MPKVSKENPPNIQKRITPCGFVRFRVRIRFNNFPFLSITFETEKEAREWLSKNYYEYRNNPEKYMDLHKKKW